MMPSAEWFVIGSGSNEGTIHMAGWDYSAHLGISTGKTDDGWLSFATCPRCFAMVLNDRGDMLGREILLHDSWHSNTDHPIPPEVTAEQGRIYAEMTNRA